MAVQFGLNFSLIILNGRTKVKFSSSSFFLFFSFSLFLDMEVVVKKLLKWLNQLKFNRQSHDTFSGCKTFIVLAFSQQLLQIFTDSLVCVVLVWCLILSYCSRPPLNMLIFWKREWLIKKREKFNSVWNWTGLAYSIWLKFGSRPFNK